MKIKLFTMTVVFISACDANTDFSELQIVRGKKINGLTDQGASSTVGFYTSGSNMCTGTLIGPNHIVSAAHCLTSSRPVEIFYGPDLKKLGVQIKDFAVHESYQDQEFDISIIGFTGPLPAELVPVKLANSEDVKEGAPLLLLGYGVSGEGRNDSGILRSVETSIDFVDADKNEFIQKTGGGGSCYGDSGGPAYILKDGMPLTLAGATSRGDNCDIGNGTYTNVAAYKDWMTQNFDKMSLPIDFNSIPDDTSSQEFDFKIAYAFDSLSVQSSDLYVSHLGTASEIGYCQIVQGNLGNNCDKTSMSYRAFSASSLKSSQGRIILESKNAGDLRNQNVKIVALDISGRAVANRLVTFDPS